VVIGYARLEDAATAGAGAAVTLPLECVAQRSFRQLGADLDVLAVRGPATAPATVLRLGPGDGGRVDVRAPATAKLPIGSANSQAPP
jgi:hypothetical protein